MTTPAHDQSDRLLWMLGGAVIVVAAISAMLFFWPASERGTAIEVATVASPARTASAPPPAAPAGAESPDANLALRLNRARLALDAGMLLEPEGFSAWSLYSDILARDPNQPAATEGLAAVATALVERARAAATEGRDADADALIGRVLDRFPLHEDALALRDRRRVAVVVPTTAPTLPRPEPAAVPAPRITVPPQPNREPSITLTLAREDLVVATYPEFVRALASGALVAPPERSAEHFVEEMRRIDPVHSMTRDAERQLFDALLNRYETAFDDLDTQAALTWLDTAERMSVDSARVAAARDAIVAFTAERAANEVVSASELTMTEYVAPTFPSAARRRGVEGWVDMEFMLGKDGIPRAVAAIDASHLMFEQEAIVAVSKWRFEPYRIMGHAVEQRVRTRIRFVFE